MFKMWSSTGCATVKVLETLDAWALEEAGSLDPALQIRISFSRLYSSNSLATVK